MGLETICDIFIKISENDVLFKHEGKFFIILENKKIEVSKEIFENYKHLCWKFEYNEEKHGKLVSLDTYGYADHLEYIYLKDKKTLEDLVVDKIIIEKVKIISRKHQNGTNIIKKMLQGYRDTEIAEELGISRQLFAYQKEILFKEIRKEFKKDNF